MVVRLLAVEVRMQCGDRYFLRNSIPEPCR